MRALLAAALVITGCGGSIEINVQIADDSPPCHISEIADSGTQRWVDSSPGDPVLDAGGDNDDADAGVIDDDAGTTDAGPWNRAEIPPPVGKDAGP